MGLLVEHQLIKNKPGIRYYFHDNNVVWLKVFNVRSMKKCSLHLKGGSMDKLCHVDQSDGVVYLAVG